MGFKDLFIEKVEDDDVISSFNSGLNITAELIQPEVNVNTDNVEQDTLISDIYTNNGLSDFSHSIFKAQEMIMTLPKEMPTETKRNTVISILNSFGITVEEMIEDGDHRTDILSFASDTLLNENKSLISRNESEIEAKKERIEELEQQIFSLRKKNEDISIKVNDEVHTINELIAFLNGGEEECL